MEMRKISRRRRRSVEDTELGHFTLLRPVYTGDFCRGNSMQFLSRQNCIKFKHVRNPCDIAATNRTKNRTWFTRAIL